ncbi:hypothetical protein OS493_037042 [Desmophyllum pertusum]|uniref:MICOS complex subunit n=1 Tax=Desmophyllum pertusum TaxID=174260 RepID=A0A9W9ZW12_9CNID|nr:hypothetical protein OS493_037042 [Desmophyllum pertusum]
MAVGRVWRSRLLVAISVPVLGVPFLQTVKAGSMKVHPRELEIYDPVEASQDKLNEEEITVLEEKVSVGRRFVWGWTSKVKDGVANLRNTLSSVEDKSLEFVELIRTDRQFQMKVGGITTAVLGGTLLAGRGRRPIRRIFFSSVLGTSAAAICYPKQAVEITQTSYHRLKVFINEQRNKYNQKQAEKAAKEELKTPVEETQISEDQDNPIVEVAKEEDVKSQIEVSDVQEKTTEPAVAAEEKPQSSFWSKVPFLNKFIGGKSSTTGDVSPVQVSEEKGAANTESSKDQVIVQEDSPSEVKAEGDTGQSNPEDKDMYSTRT